MTSVTTKSRNKDYFRHSQVIIIPLIEARDGILTQYHTLVIVKWNTSFTKQLLHNKKHEVNDAIALENDNWSAYQSERINSMRFNTKEPCKSVNIISSGEITHHKNIIIMRMGLPDGYTAISDAENELVLGTYFAKVFWTDIPVDWYALD